AASLTVVLGGFGDYVDRTQIHKELPRRLFDLLLINHLAQRSEVATAILNLLNIIEFRYFAAEPENFQRDHVRAMVHYDHVGSFLGDPAEHLRTVYGWNTAEFDDLALI